MVKKLNIIRRTKIACADYLMYILTCFNVAVLQICSCGKGPHCIHVMFIMLRVFQVKENDPMLFKKLKNYEVRQMGIHVHVLYKVMHFVHYVKVTSVW